MATVRLDRQIFYTPLPAANPKLINRSLSAWNGGTSTTVSGAPLTLLQEPGSPRQDEVVEISSDEESDDDDLNDGQSRQQAEPGSVAGVGKGINTTPGTNSDNDTKKPSVTGGSNPDDKSTSTQQRPEPLSASPGALRTKLDLPGLAGSVARKPGQAPAPKGSVCDTTVPKTAGASLEDKARPHGHGSQHDSRPSTQSGGKNSDRDSAMRPDPTDHAAWDKRYPFSLAALGRRKLAERAKESVCKAAVPDYPEPVFDSVRRPQSPVSIASNHVGETQQRPDSRYLSQRHHQGDSNQTSDLEHRHPPVSDNREQNKVGPNVLLQAQESQASTPTLSDDKSHALSGLHPNTIAAIQHLQRRWRARGKDKTKPSLAEGEHDQEDGARPPVRERCSVVTPAQTGITRTSPHKLRSRGSGRADVRTDNHPPTINDDHDENGGNIVPSHGHKRRRTRIHQPRDLSETRLDEEGDEVIQDSDRSSDRDARGDKHFAPSHDGRTGDDEENNVRPPSSKRPKSNRHPSEAEPKSGWSLRRRLASRRDDSARAEDEEGDDTCQPPSKRRKASSLARSTILGSAIQQHLHLDAASCSQRVRTSASGRKRFDRHGVLGLPPSRKSIDRKTVFEEWPLGNAVLKRVTVGGMTTFQVQFTWDTCATHGRKDHATEDPQDNYPVRKSSSLRRGGAAGPPLTPEDTLIELTDDGIQSRAPTEEETEWEFEKILGTRKRGRGNQVLVKWTHSEKPTWEPMKNFLGTEALHAYGHILH